METKSAIISIIGKPNAGKSTLLNRIIGQKISITTHKAQTTRNVIKGIYTKDFTQLIFIDTPGIFNPSKPLEKAMVRTAWAGISGSDVICIIADVFSRRPLEDEFTKMMKHLSKLPCKKIVIYNKIDCASEITKNNPSIENLMADNKIPDISKENINSLREIIKGEEFFISATENRNVDELLSFLMNSAQNDNWQYSDDEITTASSRFLAEEITREQIFLRMNEEIPYNITVETDKWEHISDEEVRIFQSVVVKRNAHKIMVLGKNGDMIKRISTKAREEISHNLGLKVHLFLFVKIREDWDTKSSYYQSSGMQNPFK
jgi:GTPase